MDPALFEPAGSVWSWTIVRISVQGRTPPYGLAYLDLEEGPRILVQFDPGAKIAIGCQARIAGLTEAGDLRAIVDDAGGGAGE